MKYILFVANKLGDMPELQHHWLNTLAHFSCDSVSSDHDM